MSLSVKRILYLYFDDPDDRAHNGKRREDSSYAKGIHRAPEILPNYE